MTDIAVEAAAAPQARAARVATGGAVFLGLLAVATAVPWLGLPYLAKTAAQGGLSEQAKTLLVFLGSGVHVAASYAFYLDPDLRPLMRSHRGRYLVAPVVAVLGTGVLLAVAGPRLGATAVLLYLVWQTHHYTRQNIGVFAFAARARRSLPASHLERAAITTAGYAGVIGMVPLATRYQQTPFARPAMYAHNVAALVFLGAVGLLLLCLPRALEAGDPVRLAFLVGGVAFYLPTFLYRDPFSAVASYAIAHGCQYLVFMGYVAGAQRSAGRRRMLVATAALAAAGGLLLWRVQYHHIAGRVGAFVFGAYLGVVMAHFVIDAGVWRLSEPFQRRYMAQRFRFLAG
jgi:hypothetical protein